MKVFISYRRDESLVHARSIRQELVARYGADAVFMDTDDMAGEGLAQRTDDMLDATDVVVALIGPRWHSPLQPRPGSEDNVRHALARALARRMRVVPVRVAG